MLPEDYPNNVVLAGLRRHIDVLAFSLSLSSSNRPSLSVAHQGRCTNCSQFICTDIHAPVCGSNGQTYGNECELRRVRDCR